jgi:hypothetical protein
LPMYILQAPINGSKRAALFVNVRLVHAGTERATKPPSRR